MVLYKIFANIRVNKMLETAIKRTASFGRAVSALVNGAGRHSIIHRRPGRRIQYTGLQGDDSRASASGHWTPGSSIMDMIRAR